MKLEDIFQELEVVRGTGPKLAFEEFLGEFGHSLEALREAFDDGEVGRGVSPHLDKDVALDRLIHFFNLHGDATFVLACHASLPPSLGPDLLQTIRASLDFASPKQVYAPEWEEAIRLLLSENFRQVEGKTYEMDLATRKAFFRCLRLCFGESRIKELARVLLSYFKDILSTPQHPDFKLAKVHEITAYAFLDPERAVQELSACYADLSGSKNSPERMRLAALVASLAEQLQDHPELIHYAETWQAEIQQDSAHLRAALTPLLSGGTPSSDALMLPVPVEMYRQLRAEQIAADPINEARRRIEEVKQQGGSTLDLSHIGLQELPEEIGSLTELTVLVLDGNAFVKVPEIVFSLTSLQRLSIDGCGLRTILRSRWREMVNLRQLSLASNQLRWLSWNLLELAGLESINLENNRFASLPYEWLDSGKALYLDGNLLPAAPPEEFNISSQANIQQQVAHEIRGNALDRLQQLKEVQEEMEKGGCKMIQILSWTGPNRGIFPMVDRLTTQNADPLQHAEDLNIIDKDYWLVNGIDLGLPVDTVLHLQTVIHGVDEIGIQALCGKGAIILIDPLTLLNGDTYAIEPFISRLPKGLSLSVGVVVDDPLDEYLKDLLTLISQRHPDRIKELFILDRNDSLSLEILLDYAQARSQDGLAGPGRGNYPSLLALLNRATLISEKDVSSIDSTSNEIGYRYLSEANLSTALVEGKFLRRVEGFHARDTYYYTPIGLVKIFEQVMATAGEHYVVSLEDATRAVRQNYSSPGMATYVLDLFFQLSWISPIPNTRNLHFVYAKCIAHFQSKTLPIQVDQNASVQLTGYAALVPHRLKEMLLVNSLSESPEIVNLDEDSLEIAFPGRPNVVFRFPNGQHEVSIYCDNREEDGKTLLSDLVLKKVSESLKPMTAPSSLEWWVQPRKGDTEKQELKLFYPTIQALHSLNKNSHLQWDQWAWASNAYALGINNDLNIVPSSRKTVLFYARDDFQQAFELIELLGGESISLLPYTPDLYHNLENPSLGEMLEVVDRVILLFTDRFIASHQAMGYWKGLFYRSPGSVPTEVYRDGSFFLPEQLDIRRKTIVISDFKGSAGVERAIQYWQQQAHLPLPHLPITADPFAPNSFPYHYQLWSSANEILPRIEETYIWSSYKALFRKEDLEERKYKPLIELLPKSKGNLK